MYRRSTSLFLFKMTYGVIILDVFYLGLVNPCQVGPYNVLALGKRTLKSQPLVCLEVTFSTGVQQILVFLTRLESLEYAVV